MSLETKEMNVLDTDRPTKTFLWHIDHALKDLPSDMDRRGIIREAMKRHSLRNDAKETIRERAIASVMNSFHHAERSPEVDTDALFVQALRALKD